MLSDVAPIDLELLGEEEDASPCPVCGHDYIFVLGNDPGACAYCRKRKPRKVAAAFSRHKRESRKWAADRG